MVHTTNHELMKDVIQILKQFVTEWCIDNKMGQPESVFVQSICLNIMGNADSFEKMIKCLATVNPEAPDYQTEVSQLFKFIGDYVSVGKDKI